MPAPAPTQKLSEDSCQRRMAVHTFIISVTPVPPAHVTRSANMISVTSWFSLPVTLSLDFVLNLTLDRKCPPLSWLRRDGFYLPAGVVGLADFPPLADCNCKTKWLSHVMLLGQDTLVPTQKLEDPEAWQIEAWHLLSACGVFLFLEHPGFLAAVEYRSPSRIRKHFN